MTTIKSTTAYPLLILILFLLSAQVSFAQTRIELIPSLSILAMHDSNIYLAPHNETSDYLTEVTPGLSLNLLSQNTRLGLEYAPTFVWYKKEKHNDTTRHYLDLTFDQDLSEHLQFNLTNTYIKSEDPLGDIEDVIGARRERQPYQRNLGTVGFNYLFGPQNTLTVGYRHDYLKNEAADRDDGRTQNPFATVSYHINVKHCIEFDYEYTKADFWREDDSIAQSDYTGHRPGIRYIYSFTPHSTGNMGYALTTRRFDNNLLNQDYKIHNTLIGLDHSFSHDFTVSAGGGFFIYQGDDTGEDSGHLFHAEIDKQFERGFINIMGDDGWEEQYLLTAGTGTGGLIRYSSANASIGYDILEPLTGYVRGSYRTNKDNFDRDWDMARGSCGLEWTFFRWFSLALDYSYAERDDNVDTADYRDKRVSLIFTASRLYRW